MASTLRVCLCKLISLLGGVVLLGCAASVQADPKPLSKEEQAKVDKAIDKGVEFLKNTQLKDGTWPRQPKERVTNLVGSAAFPALAMLESGVRPADVHMRKVAELIRQNVAKMYETYDVSLAILFLDRLGDPKDKELILDLALRLIASQSYSGGWGYRCPTLSKQNRDDLLRTLQALQESRRKPDAETPRSAEVEGKAGAPTVKIPPKLKILAIFRPPSQLMKPIEPDDKGYVLYVGTTDNSNTQFAMLALLVAHHHGVPLDRTFRLVVQRFKTSQLLDGTWTYRYPVGGWDRKRPHYTRAMTTVGLLGLVLEYGLREKKEPPGQVEDQRIVKALAALSREIDNPTGQMSRPLPQSDLYFLWSVERVAMLYHLPTIGDKDWYRWGVEILITNQDPQGNWRGGVWRHPKDNQGSYSWYTNTSFALLFLKRSNLTKDLTAKLPLKAKDLNKEILALTGSSSSKDTASPGSGDTKDRTAKPPP